MRNKLDGLAVKVLAAAISLGTSGCAGLGLHTDVMGSFSFGEYTQKTGQIPKAGITFSQGMAKGKLTPRLSVGIRYGQLPPSTSEEHIFKLGKVVDETVKEESDGIHSIDGFFLVEHKVWQVEPTEWYRFNLLAGLGAQINLTSEEKKATVGDSDPLPFPDIKPVNDFRVFLNHKAETVLGPKSFQILVQLDNRIYMEECANLQSCVDIAVSAGFRLNWDPILYGKDKSVCDYLPDRKSIPLEFRLERSKDEDKEKGVCTTEYHRGGKEGRHLKIELYFCEEPVDCRIKYNKFKRREGQDEIGKQLPTSDNCFAVERPYEGGMERVLTCNFVDRVFYKETVLYKPKKSSDSKVMMPYDNSDLKGIPNDVYRKVFKDLSKKLIISE